MCPGAWKARHAPRSRSEASQPDALQQTASRHWRHHVAPSEACSWASQSQARSVRNHPGSGLRDLALTPRAPRTRLRAGPRPRRGAHPPTRERRAVLAGRDFPAHTEGPTAASATSPRSPRAHQQPTTPDQDPPPLLTPIDRLEEIPGVSTHAAQVIIVEADWT